MGLISFGKISKVHGLAGEVKFLPFSGQLDNISTLERIFLNKTSGGPLIELKIIKRSFHKGSATLKLDGISSIDDAEKLIGNHVYVETSDLRSLEDDEFYWFDLIGLETFTDDGQYIGIVDSLIDRSLQSILVVKNEGKEHLIPLTEPIVKEIDLKQSKIIISPIKGLLD